MTADPESEHLELLGEFRVIVAGREVAGTGWRGRRPAEACRCSPWLIATASCEDQVIEALWPHLGPEAGAATLRALFPPCQVETAVQG